ncbi:helix-turn-helix domain-containing protein [soil metagenome]
MKGITHVTPADGNIFADLALKDAENLKLRAQLMIEIERYIEEHGLTQTEAAERMRTTQPRINDIVQGRMEKCTIDRLVNMLAAVGRHVR